MCQFCSSKKTREGTDSLPVSLSCLSFIEFKHASVKKNIFILKFKNRPVAIVIVITWQGALYTH